MDNISLGDKACTTCSTALPNTAGYFARHKASKGGLTAQCKSCIQATKTRWYERNKPEPKAPKGTRESMLESKRKYNRSDRAKASKKKWIEENREKLLQAKREYYKRNKEKWREYEKKDPVRTRRLKAESAKRNPEAQRTKCRNRSARLKNAPGLHTVAEIKQMYECQKGLCAYCEVELNGTYHVDHMTPITREGRNDWTNLAITCATCNSSKSAKTAEEFFASRKG